MTDKKFAKESHNKQAVREKIKLIDKLIDNRYRFYYKNLRFMLLVWILGFITLICTCVAVYKVYIKQQVAFYIPADLDGTVIKVEDIQSPSINGRNISDKYVVDWVLNAIPEIYSYQFTNSQGNFTSVIKYFTSEGFKEYAQAIQGSKALDTISVAKTVVLGVGCNLGDKMIVYKGVKPVQGYPVYVWELRVPLVTRNIGADKSYTMVGELDIRVQRVPKMLSQSGIAIWQFIFKVESKDQVIGDDSFENLCTKNFMATR